jgi:Transposase IS116/IS110/IS902 family
MDLTPGGARRNLTAKLAAALLATVTPTGQPAVTRWQLATELVAELRQLEQQIAAVEARIKTAVAQSRTTLVELFGVGPVLAATFLGEVGDIGRFPSKHHFAAHTGTAPLEASSGQVVRHRLSRAGDRKLNHALYMMAMVQVRPAQHRAGVLPAQAGRGQVAQGGPAVSETAAVRRRLPLPLGRSAPPAMPSHYDRLTAFWTQLHRVWPEEAPSLREASSRWCNRAGSGQRRSPAGQRRTSDGVAADGRSGRPPPARPGRYRCGRWLPQRCRSRQ